MAGTGDPSEDTPEVTLVDASAVAGNWEDVGKQLDNIGHQVAALKARGVGFPDKINSALAGIGQGCTSVGAQWTTAAADVQKQHDEVDTPKSADYKTKTAEVQTAKKSLAQGLMIAALGGSPAYATSAQSSLATKRAERQKVLDTAVGDTAGRVQALPGHGRLAGEAVTTARSTMVTQTSTGGKTLPDDVQQIVPNKVTTPTNNTGANKPASNTPSSPSKPTSEKPSANKSAVDDNRGTGDPSNAKSQQGQQPSQQSGQQQGGQPQGGQPQQAQPQSGAPAGGQPSAQQRSPGALPVSTPTPIRGTDPSKGGSPSVRPSTPPSPPSTQAQRAGVEGRTSPLGSGTTATGAGTGTPTANKAGGVGGSTGGSTSGSGAGTRPMGGMMGGGHGGGGQGGTARAKGEVKADPRDKKLRGEDVAEQALGGVVRDGDDGRPIPPSPPGSNGGAPTPPPISPKS